MTNIKYEIQKQTTFYEKGIFTTFLKTQEVDRHFTILNILQKKMCNNQTLTLWHCDTVTLCSALGTKPALSFSTAAALYSPFLSQFYFYLVLRGNKSNHSLLGNLIISNIEQWLNKTSQYSAFSTHNIF